MLGQQIGGLDRSQLEIDCGTAGCRGKRAYLLHGVAGVFGKHLTVAAVLRRLRCQDCGKAPARAAVVTPLGAARPVMIRVVVLGQDMEW